MRTFLTTAMAIIVVFVAQIVSARTIAQSVTFSTATDFTEIRHREVMCSAALDRQVIVATEEKDFLKLWQPAR